MTESFGILPSGETATLYTTTNRYITASVTDYGATLVRLLVPDASGNPADSVLGYDDCNGYGTANGACLSATVGRNTHRLKGAKFNYNDTEYTLTQNTSANNLHSGPDYFHLCLWKTVKLSSTSATFELNSPDGDQGFPGNTIIQVTYELDYEGSLHIQYDAVCDQDMVFNMTNQSGRS